MRFALLVVLLVLGVHAINAETGADSKVAPKGPLANVALEKLIGRMIDANASFKERCDAEDELARRPAKEVLPGLLPLVVTGVPDKAIYNSLGSREADRQAPVRWQIYYAVNRAWLQQLDGIPPKEAGKVLAVLLKGASKNSERSRVIYALATYWDAGAEADLAKLLKNANEPSHLRQEAALPLILHGKEDYRDVMLQWAARAEYADGPRWFELLADSRVKQRKGVDPRIVCLGFQLIDAARNKHPDYIHAAYFRAGAAGDYVGQKFAPDPLDPKYKREGGLNDRFFEDTVHNALRWWDKNREKYEKK